MTRMKISLLLALVLGVSHCHFGIFEVGKREPDPMAVADPEPSAYYSDSTIGIQEPQEPEEPEETRNQRIQRLIHRIVDELHNRMREENVENAANHKCLTQHTPISCF